MTTIVVVRKNGVAAIAADSLTTFGGTRLSATYDRAPDKILAHEGSYLGIAGSAAHQLVMESLLQRHPGLSFQGRAEIFEAFRRLHPLLKDEHFLNPKEEDDDPYESSQLTTLIANSTGIFGVYSLREVFEYNQFWAIGSGREFAIGAMWAAYEGPGDAADIARLGVSAGAQFDTGSALPIQVHTVSLVR